MWQLTLEISWPVAIFLGSRHPCDDTCPFMMPTSTFVTPAIGESYPLCNNINCKTSLVIYGLVCSCPKLYVGQTSQQLRKRIQNHVSTINIASRDARSGRKLTSVAEHFLKVHQGKCSDLRVIGLDKIPWSIRGVIWLLSYYIKRPDGFISCNLWHLRASTRFFGWLNNLHISPLFWVICSDFNSVDLGNFLSVTLQSGPPLSLLRIWGRPWVFSFTFSLFTFT